MSTVKNKNTGHWSLITVLTAISFLVLQPSYLLAEPKQPPPEVKVKELKIPEVIIKGKDETILSDKRKLLVPKGAPTAFKEEPKLKLEGSVPSVPIEGEKASPKEVDPGGMYSNCCTSLFSRTVKGDEGYYKAAVAKYLKEDVNGAYELFTKLVTNYPKGKYTGDSYYWIAEINYKNYNRVNEAKKFYELVIADYPDARLIDYTYYSQAFISFAEGNFKDAKKYANEAFEAKPKGEVAEVSLVISALSSYYLAEYEEYLTKCDKILSIFPETKYAPVLTYIKGTVLYILEEYDNAKKELVYFADNYKDSGYLEYNLYALGVAYVKLGLLEESIKPNEELLKMSPNFKFADVVMYSLIKAYSFDGKLDMASAMLKKLETQFPNSSCIENAHYELAYKYFMDKDYEEARKRLLTFLEKFPTSILNGGVYFMLAGAEFNLTRYVDAIKHYDIFIGTSKDDKLIREAMLHSAYAYYLDNLPKEAAHSLEKLINNYGPDYEKINEARYFLGESYYKMTDLDKAESMFLKIDVKDEYYPRALLALGWIKFDKKDFPAAIDSFTKYFGTGSQESLAETYLVMAETYFNVKEYDKADESLKEIVKRFNDTGTIGKVNYLMGLINFKKDDYKTAIALLSDVLGDHKEDEYADDSMYWLGLSYFQLERYEDAANEFSKLVKEYPSSPFITQATLKTGDCYYNLKRYTSAAISYKSVVEKSAGTDAAITGEYGLIQTVYAQENYEAFVSKSKEFTKNYPTSPFNAIIYFQFAEYYAEQGDWANAAQSYEEMAKLYPQSEEADDAFYKAGMVLYKAEKYDRALEDLLVMANNYPNSILVDEANYYIANSYFALKKYQDAVKYYDMTTQKMPKTDIAKESFNKASEAYLKLNDYKQAAGELVKSAEMFNEDPFDKTTYIKIGDIYFSRKDYDNAISYYKKGLDSKYKGVGVSAQMKIADVYYSENDFESALLEYLKIIYLHKNEPTYVDDAYIKIGNLYIMMDKKEEAKKIFLRLQDESLNPDKVGIAIEKLKELGVNE